MTTLAELRKALPLVEIEDDPYDIGYWTRVAGLRLPSRPSAEMQDGYDKAERELAAEAD